MSSVGSQHDCRERDRGPPKRAVAGGRYARLKTGLTNVALVVVSLAITYFVAEYAFFSYALPHLSMNLRPHLPDRADFYLQNSKTAYIPHTYIALIGDSYAQGMGDWLLSVGGKNDRPYHSANVIHDLTGRDVVTFGRAAAGSAEALVLRVTRILGDSYCYLFAPIETPKEFFIYVYEGNDIYENNRLLELLPKQVGSEPRATIDRFLERNYGSIAQWRCHGHLGDTIFRMARFLVRDAFAKNCARWLGSADTSPMYRPRSSIFRRRRRHTAMPAPLSSEKTFIFPT